MTTQTLPPGERKATAYGWRGDIILNRVDTTIDGIPVSTSDVVRWPRDVSPEIIGRDLVRIIDDARSGIAPIEPDQWGELFRPILTAAGVKTWRQFMSAATDLSIFEDAGLVYLVPSVNLGPSEGFDGILDAMQHAPLRDHERLGEAIIRGLALSR
jgi:hypothetical protein